MRLTWLADVLRDAGLKVTEVSGWQSRGASYVVTPRIFIYHHTAENKNSGNAGGLGVVTNGRSGLPGPIANLYLGRDGRVYVVASGISNNAGRGNARVAGLPGLQSNGHTIAMEMANNGIGEPYAPAMYTAAIKVGAAIAKRLNLPNANFLGHKEWSTSGKIDPTWNMTNARNDILAMRREVVDNKPAAAETPTPVTTAEEGNMHTILCKVKGSTAVYVSFDRMWTRWIADEKMLSAADSWDIHRLKTRHKPEGDKDGIAEVESYDVLWSLFGPPQPGTKLPAGVPDPRVTTPATVTPAK